MKRTALFCLILGISLIAWSCRADTLNFKLGPTLNSTEGYANKIAAFGYTSQLSQIFNYRFEGGAFSSLVGTETYYGSAQLGLQIRDDHTYIRYFVGPAYISETSPWLATNIELNNSIEIGIHDKRGVELGAGYFHFSNAGIKQPNVGRDFIGLQVGIPLGGSK